MSVIVTQLRAGEEMTISTSRKRTKHKIPPYIPLGKAGMSKFKVEGMDVVSIFIGLSPGATRLWWTMVKEIDWETNMVVIRSAELSKNEQNKLSKAYGELNKVGLVKRVKREHYLINPAAVLPQFSQYELVALKYNAV